MLNDGKIFGLALLNLLYTVQNGSILGATPDGSRSTPCQRLTVQKYEDFLKRQWRFGNKFFSVSDRTSHFAEFIYRILNLSFFSFIFSGAFARENPFIIMYVNINRYYKIYYSNPPYTYIGPRANAQKKRKDKKDIFVLRIVNEGKKPLRYFMFFTIFSTFLCYRRKFSVTFTFGEDSLHSVNFSQF